MLSYLDLYLNADSLFNLQKTFAVIINCYLVVIKAITCLATLLICLPV